MSGNTKHLAKKCVKDAGPCLALCAAGAAVALLAVLGPFDVLRSASSLHVCMALAGAMMTGGVLDLVFWVLDPFGWKNEGEALRDGRAGTVSLVIVQNAG